MTEYDRLLEEAKNAVLRLAKNYVPELYGALMKEPNMTPKDAGDRIKKDLALTWSPKTINKHLPDEAKHEEKDRSNKDIEESAELVPQIVIGQSTSGNFNEPVTDKPNNDQYGMGVVPMSNESPPEPKSQGVRIVMSGGKFAGLITAMKDIQDANGMKPRYVIEYDPKERDLYVDLAEEGEAKNVDD